MRPTIIERAYELSRRLPTLLAIRKQLSREGYESVDTQLAGKEIRRTLRRKCREAAAQRDAMVMARPAASEP
jgi:hypothetical protein